MRALCLSSAIAIIALAAVTTTALADETMTDMSITLTNTGITQSVSTPGGGLYLVTIVNDSTMPRGVVIKGIDSAVSPYIRFTKVLKPGQTESFRWFFPAERNVVVRDLLMCKLAEHSCMAASVGDLSASINFGEASPAAGAAGPRDTQ